MLLPAAGLLTDPRVVAEHTHLEFEIFELALDDVPDANDPDQGLARENRQVSSAPPGH